MSLRILIADDEPLARTRLRALIEQLGHEVCGEAGDGRSAEAELHRTRPDAVLLDIEMPNIDGLTLAQRIQSQFPGTPVLLVTAHAEHALAAYEAAVRDYLLKPVRVERLKTALDRLSRGASPSNPAVAVSIGRKKLLVPLNEIDCFLADDGYVVARSARMEVFVDATLDELEEQLDAAVIRVHRSCLAVKAAIAGVEQNFSNSHVLLFRDGFGPVAISRRKLHEVQRLLRAPDDL